MNDLEFPLNSRCGWSNATILHCAAQSGSVLAVRGVAKLAEVHGVKFDPYEKDNNGYNVFDYADLSGGSAKHIKETLDECFPDAGNVIQRLFRR